MCQTLPACLCVFVCFRDVPYLLVSGSDDCSFKVWDLRFVREGRAEPIAHFKWHTKPIVSVEWHPADETSLVVGSSDNQVPAAGRALGGRWVFEGVLVTHVSMGHL